MVLYKLVKNFKPLMWLELGTCLGFSSSYLAAVLKINNDGKVISMEGLTP
jgi:predicted O-methyltransferase YrrM